MPGKDEMKAAARQAVLGLGRVGVRAVAKAFDSVFEDLETAATTIQRKARTSRAKLSKIGR